MNDLINHRLAEKVVKQASDQKIKVVTAESCTGGMIGTAITSVSGSSNVFHGGFVTYANEAKRDHLSVPWEMLIDKGAVSPEVAQAMAAGAIKNAQNGVTLSVAVTGIAGPGGGTAEKPVGLVYFGVGQLTADGTITAKAEKRIFREFSRESIRLRTVETALQLLLSSIS